MTPYDIVYERFLTKIEDFKLASLPSDDLREMCHGWMVSAIAKFRKCKSNLKDRDDTLAQFNEDLEEEEVEILALLIKREWLSQQLNSVLLTNQFLSGKEVKAFSQAAHLSELQALDHQIKIEAQKLSRDYTFANSDYFES